jgi:hypothetical protein
MTGNSNLAVYGIAPRDYLARAKQRLEERTLVGLFYAALEVRCFVEARQDEYLDAQKEYAKSIPKAWKIGAQGKSLEWVFSSKQIQHLTWLVGDKSIEAYHVPVGEELRNAGERLSDLLHVQAKRYDVSDPWWTETRRRLVGIYQRAWACCQGRLLCPALVGKDGQTIGAIKIELDANGDPRGVADMLKPGVRGILRVNYLDAPPKEWVCDINP